MNDDNDTDLSNQDLTVYDEKWENNGGIPFDVKFMIISIFIFGFALTWFYIYGNHLNILLIILLLILYSLVMYKGSRDVYSGIPKSVLIENDKFTYLMKSGEKKEVQYQEVYKIHKMFPPSDDAWYFVWLSPTKLIRVNKSIGRKIKYRCKI